MVSHSASFWRFCAARLFLSFLTRILSQLLIQSVLLAKGFCSCSTAGEGRLVIGSQLPKGSRKMNTNKTANKTAKAGMFVTEDGQNVLFTFLLLILLFALWGFCNGMIDVMDKHFQEVLHLSLSQSAWVQFAHYLGYFLMALPAGGLAAKLGYKGGILAGLLLVAVV